MIPSWISITLEQRAAVCQRVHRHLQRYGGQSATGLMHGIGATLDYISGALVDMEQRGTVQRKENSAGVEIWTIVVRKPGAQAQ